MSDVSLTLLRDVTSDYANNKANQFKVKLSPSLFLPGSGWEVSIAIVPKMSLFKDLQSQRVNLIELWYKAEESGESDGWKKDYLSPADLRRWEKAGACHDGVDCFNSLRPWSTFSPTVNTLSCYILINFNNNDKQIGVDTLCLLK